MLVSDGPVPEPVVSSLLGGFAAEDSVVVGVQTVLVRPFLAVGLDGAGGADFDGPVEPGDAECLGCFAGGGAVFLGGGEEVAFGFGGDVDAGASGGPFAYDVDLLVLQP